MRRTVGFKIPICEMRRDNGATVWFACVDETQQIDDKWKTRSLSGSESVETMTEQLETQHCGKTHTQIQDRLGRAGSQDGWTGRLAGEQSALSIIHYPDLARLVACFLSFFLSMLPSFLPPSG